MKIPTQKTQAQRPMSILNQFTMVQLTIDNATMPIPNPKSHITNLRARPRVPFVPSVQAFHAFQVFQVSCPEIGLQVKGNR